MSNGYIELANHDVTFLAASCTSGHTGTVGLTNNYFEVDSGWTHTNPVISITSSGGATRLRALGNQITDKRAGNGTFFNVAFDEWHRIIGNASVGWTNSFPSSPTLGVYQWQ